MLGRRSVLETLLVTAAIPAVRTQSTVPIRSILQEPGVIEQLARHGSHRT